MRVRLNPWLLSTVVYIPIAVWASMYLLVTFLPSEYFFEYYSVKPLHSTFKMGQQPRFVSVYRANKTVNFTWKDTLFCKFGDDEFVYYSHYPTARDNVKRAEKRTSTWVYQGVIPNIESICYLDSSIIHTDLFGIQKRQHLVGETFEFTL